MEYFGLSRKKQKSPLRNLPGGLVNARIASLLNGKNVNALRKASRGMKHYVKAPSQMKMAKSMLPRNVGRKPINYIISRLTGLVPAHLPFSAGGRHTSGHNTIQNWLDQYNSNHHKRQRLAVAQNRMEANQRVLGNKIKKRLNILVERGQ